MEVPVRVKCKCKGVVGDVKCFLCEDEGMFQVWVPLVNEKVQIKLKDTEFFWPLLTIDKRDLKKAVKHYKKQRKKLLKERSAA